MTAHIRRGSPFSSWRNSIIEPDGKDRDSAPEAESIACSGEKGGGSPETSRKPRADAARNRERLLDAARAVFSAGGPDASLAAVARTAGVGIGTLYRHFPTREALFQAVYSREVDELVELAERLSQTADPLPALRTWLRSSVRMIATKKGMVAALAPELNDPSFYEDKGARVLTALERLISRAVAAGKLRDDVTAEEVVRMMLGICYAREQADWQDTAVRLLDIFVDGLATRIEAGGS